MAKAKMELHSPRSACAAQDLSLLFGAAGLAPAAGGQIQQISLDLLDSHPRQGRWHMDDGEINWLAANIAQVGVLQPLQAMQTPSGRYLLLAGHKRREAARRAGLHTVPVIVEPYNEVRGDIIFNATNLGGREHLLPSEKAWAYLDLERDCADRGRTTAAIAQLTGDNVRMIQRYKRLTQLLPPLLARVDEGSIPVFSGEALAALPEEEQQLLIHVMETDGIKKLPLKQAKALQSISAASAQTLTEAQIRDVFRPAVRPPRSVQEYRLPAAAFHGLLPAGCTDAQATELVQQALIFYAQHHAHRCDDSSHR